ncbi:MAG: hypothetical protein ACYC8T_11465 [Myxococcaceae bacterium]
MTRRELRRAMRLRRAELRQELSRAKARAKAQVREQLGRNPELQKRARRRRVRALLTVLGVLLALLLLRSCTCGELPLPAPSVKDGGTVVDAGTTVKPAVRPPIKAPRIGLQRRGDLKLGDTAALTWLDEFRMQVAARSPKLSDCFHGAERPGALRWTTALNVVSGQVSNHELEPVGGTGLSQNQRECLLGTLSQPRYLIRERPDGGSSTLSRVSIMLEF